jgi:hypothetical protein
LSDFFSSEVGVRHFENLSPFLFAVFLNDLKQFMEDKNITGLESISSELEAQLEIYLKMFALLYADDTVLKCTFSAVRLVKKTIIFVLSMFNLSFHNLLYS